MPLPLSVRQSAAWLSQADRHLVDVQQWTSAREASDRNQFYQKGALFVNLVDLVPPSATRVRLLRAFADFLHQDDAERLRPLWFLFANRLLELIRSDDRDVVLQAIDDSSDPVLQLSSHTSRVTAANGRPISERQTPDQRRDPSAPEESGISDINRMNSESRFSLLAVVRHRDDRSASSRAPRRRRGRLAARIGPARRRRYHVAHPPLHHRQQRGETQSSAQRSNAATADRSPASVRTSSLAR